MTGYRRAVWLLVAVILLTQAFIELQVVYGRVNVPVVDLAALLLGVLVAGGLILPKVGSSLAAWLRSLHSLRLDDLRTVSSFRRDAALEPGAFEAMPLVLPALLPFALFIAAGLLSAVPSPWRLESLYFLLRKPLFCYLAYGVGLTGVLLWLQNLRAIYLLVLAAATLMSIVCIGMTLPLWLMGHFTTFQPVPYLAVNQKAFAVALAPYLPFIWMGRDAWSPQIRRFAMGVLGLAGVAIVMTVSKNAWITAAFALFGLARWPLRRGPRLLRQPALMGCVVLGCTGLMVLLPFLLQDRMMSDAFDSRMSLNVRAWEMFIRHPIVGYGAGTSTLFEISTFPHYRINGVDAHGVIQKVAPELGLLGIGAYLWFVWAVMQWLWRRAFGSSVWDGPTSVAGSSGDRDPLLVGAVTLGLALYVNLLLSTEAFTSSHWVPLSLALAVGLQGGKLERR